MSENLQMFSRPGYTGKLNGAILERVRFLSKELGLPNLEEKFPHLKVTDGSWRKPTLPENVNLAPYIDHTQLKAGATHADIATLCEEAKAYSFGAVCVNSGRASECAEALRGTQVKVATVCGFPLGECATAAKATEASIAIDNGASEIDMVNSVGLLKDRNFMGFYQDIYAVVEVCNRGNAICKVILETCLLSEEEIIDACITCVAAGAHFVKTSTGFNKGGATPEAIDIMLAVVGNAALVKASGGVRDPSTAIQYVRAGVRRIGTSSGVSITKGS